MSTQSDRELDWSVGRQLERKDAEIERLRAALTKIRYVEGIGQTAYKIAVDALRGSEQREHDPNIAPCDDAEFGMKP